MILFKCCDPVGTGSGPSGLNPELHPDSVMLIEWVWWVWRCWCNVTRAFQVVHEHSHVLNYTIILSSLCHIFYHFLNVPIILTFKLFISISFTNSSHITEGVNSGWRRVHIVKGVQQPTKKVLYRLNRLWPFFLLYKKKKYILFKKMFCKCINFFPVKWDTPLDIHTLVEKTSNSINFTLWEIRLNIKYNNISQSLLKPAFHLMNLHYTVTVW